MNLTPHGVIPFRKLELRGQLSLDIDEPREVDTGSEDECTRTSDASSTTD
jgi:hypothetical protein